MSPQPGSRPNQSKQAPTKKAPRPKPTEGKDDNKIPHLVSVKLNAGIASDAEAEIKISIAFSELRGKGDHRVRLCSAELLVLVANGVVPKGKRLRAREMPLDIPVKSQTQKGQEKSQHGATGKIGLSPKGIRVDSTFVDPSRKDSNVVTDSYEWFYGTLETSGNDDYPRWVFQPVIGQRTLGGGLTDKRLAVASRGVPEKLVKFSGSMTIALHDLVIDGKSWSDKNWFLKLVAKIKVTRHLDLKEPIFTQEVQV